MKIAVPTSRNRSVIAETSNAETKVGIEASKPRGKAKKVASTKPIESIDTKDTEDIEPLKNLRARPTAVAAKRSIASSTVPKPATRKKPIFSLKMSLITIKRMCLCRQRFSKEAP